MRSWIARLAARYDMAARDLLAGLTNGTALTAGRIARLDWHGDGALERCLAEVTGVEVGWIEALRAPRGKASEMEMWGRSATAWCPDCLRDDLDCRGEVYNRLAWRLGFCVTCPRHRRGLICACGRCGSRDCGFDPRRGRLRLVCPACDAAVDRQANQVSHRRRTAGPLGLVPCAGLDQLVAELQADLMASLDLARPRPEAAPAVGIAADHLAVTARELGAIALDAAWMGACRPWRRNGQTGGFSTVGVEVAHDLLGLVGAVLSDAIEGPSMNIERLRLGFPNIGVTPVGLARLISELGWSDLEELRTRSPSWAPAVARAVRRAVDTEVSQRRGDEERARAAGWRRTARGGPLDGRSKATHRLRSASPVG